MEKIDNVIAYITITAFSCCITTGLILTFATSSGIAAGAIPLTIGACILMCLTAVTCFYKCVKYFDNSI